MLEALSVLLVVVVVVVVPAALGSVFKVSIALGLNILLSNPSGALHRRPEFGVSSLLHFRKRNLNASCLQNCQKCVANFHVILCKHICHVRSKNLQLGHQRQYEQTDTVPQSAYKDPFHPHRSL
jgi:hypothetical protein